MGRPGEDMNRRQLGTFFVYGGWPQADIHTEVLREYFLLTV